MYIIKSNTSDLGVFILLRHGTMLSLLDDMMLTVVYEGLVVSPITHLLLWYILTSSVLVSERIKMLDVTLWHDLYITNP